MATESNNWKVFLELLDKKRKLEKKNQKLNNHDYLQLFELIRSIKTCFMYSSKQLFIELFSHFINNVSSESGYRFSFQFQGLYEIIDKRVDDWIDELLWSDNDNRSVLLEKVFKPNNKNIILFDKMLATVYENSNFFDPILSREDVLYRDLGQLEKSVRIALTEFLSYDKEKSSKILNEKELTDLYLLLFSDQFHWESGFEFCTLLILFIDNKIDVLNFINVFHKQYNYVENQKNILKSNQILLKPTQNLLKLDNLILEIHNYCHLYTVNSIGLVTFSNHIERIYFKLNRIINFY